MHSLKIRHSEPGVNNPNTTYRVLCQDGCGVIADGVTKAEAEAAVQHHQIETTIIR